MTMKTKLCNEKVVLYKRAKSDIWQARAKVGSGKGSWKRFSTRERDVEQAGKFAREKYHEFSVLKKHGISLYPKSFKHVADIAIKEMEIENASGNGKKIYYDYILTIRKYLIPFFHDNKKLYIDRIEDNHIQEFSSYRVDMMGRIPAKSTISNHNASLRRVFDVAVREKWIKKMDVPVITNRGQEGNKHAPRAYFRKAELKKLFKCLKERKWTGRTDKIKETRTVLYYYARFVFYTGIRPGTEADGIRFCDIDTFKGRDGKSYLEIQVDGKTGQREISADKMVKTIIEDIGWHHHAFADIDFDRSEENVFDFGDETAGIFEIASTGRVPLNLSKPFREALIECELLYDRQGKKRTLYSLRHSFATMIILDKGTNIHILAKHMGTSTNMIDRFYSHISSKHKADKLVLTSGFGLEDEINAGSGRDAIVKHMKGISQKS